MVVVVVGGGGGGGGGVVVNVLLLLFLLVLRVVLGGRFLYITIFMNFHFQKEKGGVGGKCNKIKKSKRANLSPGWSFIKRSTAIKRKKKKKRHLFCSFY